MTAVLPLAALAWTGCSAGDLDAEQERDDISPLAIPGVKLQTVLQSRYIGAQNNGGGAVNATATAAQAWETFSLDDINGGSLESGDNVFLRAGNGQYFQALNGGGSSLNAASNNRQDWEIFKIVKAGGSGTVRNGDVIGLQTFTGNWVSAQNGGGAGVFAYGAALGPWEQLKITGLPNSGGSGDNGPLAGIGPVERVTSPQVQFQFLEGPLWLESEGTLLFSDIPANRIYKLTPPNTFEVFRNSTGGANGLVLDAGGRLVACEQGGRRLSRTLPDGTITTIASTWDGHRFNSPNDAVVRSDGTIYFTDPPYGLAAGQQQELAFQGVFRLDPSGRLSTVLTDMRRPNGIALSPDESKLYVSDSETPGLRVMSVNPDGSTGPWTNLINRTSDGMAVDDAGNLYLTNGVGVEVFSAGGSKLGEIPIDVQTTNVAFGGPDRKTLYITASGALYRVRVNIAGIQ